MTDAAAALAAAQREPWWPAAYATWAEWMPDHRRRRLAAHAYYLEQLGRGAPGFALVVATQRAMLQDVGVADPDAAVVAAQREPWWPALYAAESARLARLGDEDLGA